MFVCVQLTYGLQHEFSRVLKEKMEFYSRDSTADRHVLCPLFSLPPFSLPLSPSFPCLWSYCTTMWFGILTETSLPSSLFYCICLCVCNSRMASDAEFSRVLKVKMEFYSRDSTADRHVHTANWQTCLVCVHFFLSSLFLTLLPPPIVCVRACVRACCSRVARTIGLLHTRERTESYTPMPPPPDSVRVQARASARGAGRGQVGHGAEHRCVSVW